MSKPKKILVPVDLSERSRIGVAYGAMLARSLEATMLLMTNVNMAELAVLENYASGRGIAVGDAGDAILLDWAEELAPGAKAEVTLAHHSFPADGILAVAEEHEVDMVVVPSHGRSGVKRWLLGSVAEKLARAANVPVVIVPVPERSLADHPENS